MQNQDIAINNMKEFQVEVSTWKKTLTSRMEKNLVLKNRLAEILKNNYHQNCLEEIEEFQTKFIREDEITNMFRNQVTGLDNLIRKKTLEDLITRESLGELIKNFRDDITDSENRFHYVTKSFTDFQQKIVKKNKIKN